MLDGLLLVNKPSGPTSYDLIRWIKRSLRESKIKFKIGHCGTLDPLASGLMILLFGKATKKQSELMGQEKIYRCGMKLGIRTDSADVTGKTIEEKPVPEISPTQLDKVAEQMLGAHLQIPPMFSALKKDGQPLYKLARKGEVIERAPRPITIHEFDFLRMADDTIEFRTRCTSGTYIRTLAEDVGVRLGTVATMSSLVRERIGSFDLNQALQGEMLQAMSHEQLERSLTPLN